MWRDVTPLLASDWSNPTELNSSQSFSAGVEDLASKTVFGCYLLNQLSSNFPPGAQRIFHRDKHLAKNRNVLSPLDPKLDLSPKGFLGAGRRSNKNTGQFPVMMLSMKSDVLKTMKKFKV